MHQLLEIPVVQGRRPGKLSKMKGCVFLLTFLQLLLLAAGLIPNFMDCPGYDVIWGMSRECCQDDGLPHGCECFDVSDQVDFNNSLSLKPRCPNYINLEFRLYTKDDTYTARLIKAGADIGMNTDFNPARPTKVIAHGYTDSGDAHWVTHMKDELMKLGPVNVVVVEWSQAANGPNYFQAVANTRVVGAMLGRLLQDLNTNRGAQAQSFHLIGHSLGAHVMGYAGKEFERLVHEKVGRITGLDPAGPAFEGYPLDVLLDATDAVFVDILHTDAWLNMTTGFGTRYSIGHVDFYPNGGQHQPGCPEETGGILSMLSFTDEKAGAACSHGRAIDYFTNSINICRYDPPTGDSKCTMGYHVDTSCKGDIYPETTDTDPFC